jgi:hypothetical protein
MPWPLRLNPCASAMDAQNAGQSPHTVSIGHRATAARPCGVKATSVKALGRAGRAGFHGRSRRLPANSAPEPRR